jgi:hypothetical protein
MDAGRSGLPAVGLLARLESHLDYSAKNFGHRRARTVAAKIKGTVRRERETIMAHLALLARNVCNVGRAFDLSESFGDDDDQPAWELGPKLDGYVPLATTISGDKALAFEKELAHERSVRLEDVVLDRYAAEAYRHYARQIHAAGATPVFLVSPFILNFLRNFRDFRPAFCSPITIRLVTRICIVPRLGWTKIISIRQGQINSPGSSPRIF